MQRLTAYGGGAGSLLRLFVLAVIMVPIVAAVMVRAQVPEAQAALAAFRRRIGARPAAEPPASGAPPPAGQRAVPAGQRDVAAGKAVGAVTLRYSSRTLSRGIRLRRRGYPVREPSGAGLRSK